METQKLNRFTTLNLASKLTLKNRVVIPPMASGTATVHGLVTQKTLEHYFRLSQAQAALLIVEYSYVHDSGRSEEHQLGISNDFHVPGLAHIAEIIHRSGSVAGIQISHGGGKSSNALTREMLMGPSAISVPVKGETLEVPSEMSPADIELWKDAFEKAISRAAHAGFDLVEIHSAHGYGLNQWLSPITNHRDDEYGGSLLNRSRLLCEIVRSARKQHPNLLISVRIPGQDFLPGGLSVADSTCISKMLETLGIDILHVSSGIGGWRRPGERNGEGYLVSEAAMIQSQVSIPVIGVGGIETGSYIDESLNLNKFSLAAVGRAILKDPVLWKESHLQEAIRGEG